MTETKKKIAVMFGGRSPEHDVSIVTALQVIDALDPELYDAIPVYIIGNGNWYTGDALLNRATYIPGPAQLKELTPVALELNSSKTPALVSHASGLFSRTARINFDVAIPAFHGNFGEDGNIQGLLEVARVPYTGMRTMASATFMDKVTTKHVLASTGVPVLPFAELRRPAKGYFIAPATLKEMYPATEFPCFVKPSHLGSSIGIARVNDWEELAAVLPGIFKLDNTAILEPFVQDVVEYNVAACRFGDVIRTSAIERPKHTSELLDFKAKYLSGSKNDGGAKQGGSDSEGMLSLTRDINPSIPTELEDQIRSYAATAFERVNGSGAPRFDFLYDTKTDQLWFNEANPCPGSFGYFLWQASEQKLLFPQLMNHLIEEALALSRTFALPADPTPADARLLPRHP